jgi:hypothetical protein
MNKAKVNVKNMNIKNSNSNDENVGGIDHESNGSIRNKTKTRAIQKMNMNKANA